MEKQQIYDKLAAPFETKGADGKMYPDLRWKLRTKTGACIPYIDIGQVVRRLNSVLGVEGWSNTLVETNGKSIICEMTCEIAGKSVTKSYNGEGGDIQKEKSTATDAIKRAASLFGVGDYIRNIEPVQLKMAGKYPATENGEPLRDGKALSSYINQKHPLRAKLTEIYHALSEENKSNLSEEFTKIWEALTN